jgi:hypothetical protein
MKFVGAMVLIGLVLSPAFGQEVVPRSQVPPSQRNLGSEVTYEDCVARCEKCGSGKNPNCMRTAGGNLTENRELHRCRSSARK